jgi:hypothetical protein
MAKKSNMVTRRVIESNVYQIYKMEGTQLVPIGQEITKGKVSEKELEKKYNVDKVVVVCTEKKKAVYGMPVEEFMKYAVEITDDSEDETEQE